MIIILATQVSHCGLVITNPTFAFRPLPDETLLITWESEYGAPVDLFYKTDIETDWILISQDNVTKQYTFQYPAYFFDYIEFKVVQKVPLPPRLIWEQTCDNPGDVTYGEFSPDSKRLAICTKGGFIESYNINTRTKFYSSPHENSFYHLAYLDENEIIHSNFNVTLDSSLLQVTDFNTAITKDYTNFSFQDAQGAGEDIDYCAKTNSIVVALMKTPNILIINTVTKSYKRYSTADSIDIYSVCFSENGDNIYIGDYNGSITILDSSLKLISKFAAHGNGGSNNPIWGVDCSNNGKMLATCGVDGFVKVWNTETLELMQSYKHDFHVRDVAFDKNSKNVLSASLDKSIKEWNILTGLENFSLDYKAQALSANYSVTGDTMIGTGRDKRFMVWEKQKPLVLMDSIKTYSDYIAKIYIPDIQSAAGATIEVPLMMTVNPRFTKQGINIKFTSTVSFPNRILNIYEHDYPKKTLYDMVSWDISKEIKSSKLDKKLGLTLVGGVVSDSMKLSDLIVLEPKGAKFEYHGGLLTIINQCAENSFRLVNISDTNNSIIFSSNQVSFDIFTDDETFNKKDINIYTINGYAIQPANYSIIPKKYSASVNISNFASGIYFVVLHSNGLYVVKKIIIQK